MKTECEVEQMKENIQSKIKGIDLSLEIEFDHDIVSYLLDNKRQLIAQYNILLEVLK